MTTPKLTLAQALAPYKGKYSDAFLRAIAFTLTWETVFASGHEDDYNFVTTENVKDDPGGCTRYGVDQRSHQGVNVRGLAFSAALAIYHGGEWADVKGDKLPADVALCVFDAAVNVGTGKAVKWLQKLVGAEPDGSIGEETLKAVASHQIGLADAYNAARAHYYQELGQSKSLHKFLAGWMNRTNALVKTLAHPA